MTDANKGCLNCAVRQQIALCPACGKAKADVLTLILIEVRAIRAEVQAIRAEQKRLAEGGTLIPTRPAE